MIKTIFLRTLLICILSQTANGQRLLSFDLFDSSVDTINSISFDSSITSESTVFFKGLFDEYIVPLDETIPISNIYPGSNFTFKRQASLDYNITGFPIRTSIKLYRYENDSLKSKCSGILISRKHVLTACHCVAQFSNDSLLYTSLFVSPVYDNGQFNTFLKGSRVKKVYFPENWDFNKDFSILELEEPIGVDNGWISIGFEEDTSILLNGIFYKFSYPAIYLPQVDSNEFNGDTLYYGYGLVDNAEENFLMISGASGIPGESGSSIIKISYNNLYTSYGTLSFSGDLRHSRITNWKYFAIKHIINNDLSLIPSDYFEDEIIIYPNPASEIVHIYLDGLNEGLMRIFDLSGKLVLQKSIVSTETDVELTQIRAGMYILEIESGDRTLVKKFVKKG